MQELQSRRAALAKQQPVPTHVSLSTPGRALKKMRGGLSGHTPEGPPGIPEGAALEPAETMRVETPLKTPKKALYQLAWGCDNNKYNTFI